MITNAQKQMLHVAARVVGLTRDQYEALLVEQAGVHSSSDLDNDKFDRVMKRFEELGFVNTARRTRPRDRNALISPEQSAMITALFQQLGWSERERQVGFFKRQCGKAWPQTRGDANKVIEGLKKIAAREEQ